MKPDHEAAALEVLGKVIRSLAARRATVGLQAIVDFAESTDRTAVEGCARIFVAEVEGYTFEDALALFAQEEPIDGG